MSLNNNSHAVYDPRKALLDELHDVDVIAQTNLEE